MVNLTQIELGLINYIDSEIIAKATPFNKFVFGTAVALAAPKAEKLIMEYTQMPVMKTLEIVDDDGMIDLDTLYNAAKTAVKKSGSFSISGIILDEVDIDKIYEHIKKAV